MVASHDLLHYIFIRFWRVPVEAAILFTFFSGGVGGVTCYITYFHCQIDKNQSRRSINFFVKKNCKMYFEKEIT